MAVKINSLEIENVKRIKAVKLELAQNGLTVIGGKNKQGKTSVLDAIAWALGGGRQKPSQPNRDQSVNNPYLKIVLNNGLVVERKGKNSSLTVTDPDGQKHGQNLLDSFVEELAIDLPKFLEKNNKEKADVLLQIIGVGPQLAELERQEKSKESERLVVGQQHRSKKAYAEELPHHDDVPDEFIKATDLIMQQSEILARNGENQRLRNNAEALKQKFQNESNLIAQKQAELARLQEELVHLQQNHQLTGVDVANASKTAEQLQDESTEEISASIASIEETNDKIRINVTKAQAEEDALKLFNQYGQLDNEIKTIRENKRKLLEGANLPLPGLSINEGELTFEGQQWDNMSGSQQLMVATAIVRKLQPNCGFVLIDKLEQMDIETLKGFGDWLEKEELQAIAARVTTGDEATIIIEDGEVVGASEIEPPSTDNIWTGGF